MWLQGSDPFDASESESEQGVANRDVGWLKQREAYATWGAERGCISLNQVISGGHWHLHESIQDIQVGT